MSWKVGHKRWCGYPSEPCTCGKIPPAKKEREAGQGELI